jgi:hypothetical protein
VFQNNTTALIVAASKGKLYFVRELINHGADVNAEDAVSHYQVFVIDVKVVISQEFVHNTRFYSHLVLLRYF